VVANKEDLGDLNEEGSSSEGSLVRDDDIVSLPPRLVASIDSIQENTDFIQILE
jgi:hypothetical protein